MTEKSLVGTNNRILFLKYTGQSLIWLIVIVSLQALFKQFVITKQCL